LSNTIEAQGLAKTFVKARSIREILLRPFQRAEPIEALRGVDLQVAEGEILGLLGPNGAGKTTLLKILSCLVLPDAGRAVVGGHDTADENAVKRLIGYVHSDERSFYWRLSARENLRFFARLYDVPSRRVEARIDELLDRVDLREAADRPFSGYSSGMKQRVSIARALLHDPPILMMDEPTRSLDPATSKGLRRFILDALRDRDGKTILLATHDLREAEVVSDRIAILVRGRVREIGTVSQVRRWGVHERTYTLEIDPDGGGALDGPFRTLTDERLSDVRRLTIALNEGTTLDDALRWLVGAGVAIRLCDRLEPDLEQAFSRILEAEDEAS
jgi:ABC-2 type transport system ATP-binding protein